MSVVVNIHQVLRHSTGNQATVEVQGNTVGECLQHLIQQFPDAKSKLFSPKGQLHNYIEIYVNTESAYPEELAKSVSDNDVLTITLLTAGG